MPPGIHFTLRTWQVLTNQDRKGDTSEPYRGEFYVSFIQDHQGRELKDGKQVNLREETAVWIVRGGQEYHLCAILQHSCFNTWTPKLSRRWSKLFNPAQ